MRVVTMEVNSLVFHPGPVLALFGLLRIILGAVIVVGLFYLLIKLARLMEVMAETKRASTQPATSNP
jgi:uncharacterized integral membrane protein